mmetsp:Transcript_17833/g.39020  ORF Transcript_17833/g.39020 Transcript_17833/m.39020 type:complete len:247 (-) Transcript_17833:976-1716(-)
MDPTERPTRGWTDPSGVGGGGLMPIARLPTTVGSVLGVSTTTVGLEKTLLDLLLPPLGSLRGVAPVLLLVLAPVRPDVKLLPREVSRRTETPSASSLRKRSRARKDQVLKSLQLGWTIGSSVVETAVLLLGRRALLAVPTSRALECNRCGVEGAETRCCWAAARAVLVRLRAEAAVLPWAWAWAWAPRSLPSSSASHEPGSGIAHSFASLNFASQESNMVGVDVSCRRNSTIQHDNSISSCCVAYR